MPGPSAFVPGLELAESFYREIVGPVLQREFPGLRHTAALIGPGSDVLGFDTPMSTDHGWGPRVLLFLAPSDHASKRVDIRRRLSEHLPVTFRGYATSFLWPNPQQPGDHRVDVHTLGDFAKHHLGVDLEGPLEPADWLLVPQPRLRSFVGGGVFHDDLDLQSVRRRLAWYPHDVWLYLLASGWSRIGEDEHLMGRAGFVGDEVGSAIIAARLARDVMRLAFLMERVYAPYAKWFGTAFGNLRCADSFLPVLQDVLSAPAWEDRDAALAVAYGRLASMHNDLELTPALPASATAFHERPFQVINGESFADALKAEIRNDAVLRIAQQRLVGNVDSLSDNTDLLEDPRRIARLRALYQ